MKKEKFSYDKKRQVWIGQFHELQKYGASHPPRVILGTSKECELKKTATLERRKQEAKEIETAAAKAVAKWKEKKRNPASTI